MIANLALYFAVHTLFAETEGSGGASASCVPVWSTSSWEAWLLAAGAVLVFGLRWSVLRTLGVCALPGSGCPLR